MIIEITLTLVGADQTLFDIYQNGDGYATPIATDVPVASLTTGYSVVVDDSSTKVKVISKESCNTSIIIDIDTSLLSPVATDDSFNMSKGQVSVFNIISNDTSPYGLPLTVIIDTQPLYGTLLNNNDGTVTYTHDNSENYLDSFTYLITDGVLNSNIANVEIAIGVAVGDTIVASGGNGIFLIPFVVGTAANDFVFHLNAQSVPDRFEVLFDPNNNPTSYADAATMPVVADSLFVGDITVNNQNTPANGTTTGLNLNVYNGSTFDVVETGTQSVTITDADVASNTGTRTDLVPNGPSRNGSGGTQIGVQNLVYISSVDTVGTTGLNYADGNVALKFSKPQTTAYLAYIKVTGLGTTAWEMFKIETI